MILSNKKIFGFVLFTIFIKLIWMTSSQAIVEEAYYWNYAIHLDYSFFDHPPMVGVMIAISRFLFGDSEVAIRLPAFLCWIGTAIYVYRLSELMYQGTGKIAILLASILPFFFLQSMYMTPDLPLMFFWTLTIYYCYKAIILEQKNTFYLASITLGLGLLSKYTIFLLVPATLIFITLAKQYRKWWKMKELYLGALIVFVIFSPVIYWNVIHDWASFRFQSLTRIQETQIVSIHLFFLYTLFFIFPGGVWGFWHLFKNRDFQVNQLFIKIYTSVPLMVFAVYSFHNQLKFNWLGPVFIPLLPWLAYLFERGKYPKHLFNILLGIVPLYAVAMGMLLCAKPEYLYKQDFSKFFCDWQGLAIDLNQVASRYESEFKKPPVFLGMDKYNINSELVFYQQKAKDENQISKSYQVLGQHVINFPSLMFKFWDTSTHHHGEKVILLSWNKQYLNSNYLSHFMKLESPIQEILTHDSRQHYLLTPMYYQLAELL